MGRPTDPDPATVDEVYGQLVEPRGPVHADPLDRYRYLEGEEALVLAVLARLRREKHAMVAEASAGGRGYKTIARELGVSPSRVPALLLKHKKAQGAE